MHENGVADSIAEQRADVGGGVKESGQEIGGSVAGCEDVLEQDRMPRVELCGQESIGCDDRKVEAVADGDELCIGRGVQRGDGFSIARIDFLDTGVLDDELRFVVAHAGNFVGDFLKVIAAHGHTEQFFASEGDLLPGVGHGRLTERLRCAASIGERVEGERGVRRDAADGTGVKRSGQRAGHGDLVDAVFGKRDADRVADAVIQKRADTDGALDAAILAIAGLGDAEVDGIIPIGAEFIQPGNEQPIGVDHHLGIAGLHREDEGVIIHLAGDSGEFQRALHHAERRIAVAVHDAVGKRAVIGADAHRDAAILAKLHQRREPLANALQLREVLLISVLDDLEFLRVGIVAGIDADLFHPARGFQRGFWLEMDIGDDWDIAALLAEALDDDLEIRGVLDRGSGDANDLAADGHEGERLADAGVRVHRVARDHRLEADRVRAADADRADHHLTGGAAGVGIRALAVIHF